MDTIEFLLNGERVLVGADTGLSPTTTLLQWLREQRYLVGTKEGCAEGDCGACTVAVAERNDEGRLLVSAINACIRFLPTLHGCAVFTVEYLRAQTGGALHPVQQAMVNEHGAQCGFCTPGFIMSLWTLYINQSSASRNEIASALTGNLCRCTGYRPILDAGEKMFSWPRQEFNGAELEGQINTLTCHQKNAPALSWQNPKGRFDAPTTINDLLALRHDYPQATILAGGTDIGLWVTKQNKTLPHIIYFGAVQAMKTINVQEDAVFIGAGANLEKAYHALCRHYPQLATMQERFASRPIRNAGTLGGNVANGSPIGDSMPALMVLGATVRLGRWDGNKAVFREVALEDFYVDYMKKSWLPDEAVIGINVPINPAPNFYFATYKISKRFDSDISAVCGAFAVDIEDNIVTRANIAFGGMAATTQRARHTETVLQGLRWCEENINRACAALDQDYQPLTDMRASKEYRQEVAKNLLKRFYWATQQESPLPEDKINVFHGLLVTEAV